ncbi:MAG: hypothetical protein QQN63_08600 [Nitrosopumilus sp.]
MAPIMPGVWIPVAALILLALGWAITAMSMLGSMKRDCSKLIWMHENADDCGFGTIALRQAFRESSIRTDRLIENNTRATNNLTHYIVWFIKETSGKEPPPPLSPLSASSSSIG